MMAQLNGTTERLLGRFKLAVRRTGVRPTRFLLAVSVARQRMSLFKKSARSGYKAQFPQYCFKREFVISTSRFGIGQIIHSNQTPLGLHRIARKVGGGYPVGTIFKARLPVGLTWQGQPDGTIVHRILWLEGLEAGLNKGGNV